MSNKSRHLHGVLLGLRRYSFLIISERKRELEVNHKRPRLTSLYPSPTNYQTFSKVLQQKPSHNLSLAIYLLRVRLWKVVRILSIRLILRQRRKETMWMRIWMRIKQIRGFEVRKEVRCIRYCLEKVVVCNCAPCNVPTNPAYVNTIQMFTCWEFYILIR